MEVVIEIPGVINARTLCEFVRTEVAAHGIRPPVSSPSGFPPGGLQKAVPGDGEVDLEGLSRTPAGVRAVIDRYPGIIEVEDDELREGARAMALEVFDMLARAEAAVHGAAPESVHFHEVGEVGNIVNVCNCSLAVAALRRELPGIVFLYRAPLPTGRGTVRCSHGELLLPAPATRRILDEQGFIWEHGETCEELITPTGAALLMVLTRGKCLSESK